MKNYKTLQVVQEGPVVTASLYSAQDKNGINMEMVKELNDLVDKVEDASDVSILVFKGNQDAFCPEIELKEFVTNRPSDIYGFQKWEKICRRLECMKKFTIAVAEGRCTGGGFQLFLLCDARIATPRVKFSFNEVKLGFLPGMATFRLTKYIGLGRAKSLILSGKEIKAEEAYAWGLLDQLCDQDKLDMVLKETIAHVLPINTVSLELARRLLNESYATSYENFSGHFLAAQHCAINAETFQKSVIEAKTKKIMGPGA